jgi:hypothetical protein
VQQAIDIGNITFDDPEERADIEVQLETVLTQIRSPKPKRVIVAAALKAALYVGGQVALGAAGNAAWTGLLELGKRLG